MFVSCVGRTLLNQATILRSQKLVSPLMMLSSRPYLTNVKKESVSEKMTDIKKAHEILNNKNSIENMEVLEDKTRVPQGPICSICHSKIQSNQQLNQNSNQAQDGSTTHINPNLSALLKDLLVVFGPSIKTACYIAATLQIICFIVILIYMWYSFSQY